MHVDQDGSTITLDFDAANEATLAGARALSTNAGIAICTLLRGDVALHGAGVEVDGRFLGIMAPSGAGKSTMLWALLDAGALFGNDDVIPIQICGGEVMAQPSISLHAKLSRVALEKRGENLCEYSEWVPGTDEFWVPIEAERRVQKARPLAALFVLRPGFGAELSDQVRIHRAAGGMALSLLMENTQGLMAASQQVDTKRLLSHYVDLIKTVPLYVLEYHKCMEALPALVSAMRDLIRFEAAHV